jgi:hypothetical protein
LLPPNVWGFSSIKIYFKFFELSINGGVVSYLIGCLLIDDSF